MDDRNAEAMAMFRFGLIAPVINGTHTQPSKLAYYRAVCATPFTLPDDTKASYAPSTLSYWESLYRRGGFEALIHRSRADKGYPRKLTVEAMEAIDRLRSEFPRINATIIYERLIETGAIRKHDVSLSTVQRFVRTRSQSDKPYRSKKDRKAFEAEYVCGIWQADTMYGPYIQDGRSKRRTYLMSIIDDKSRLVVGACFFMSDTAQNFQTVFKDAVIRFGIPAKLYADNGGPYKNDQLTGICGRLGCVLVHASLGDGAAKGKIERLNRTIRSRMLSLLSDGQKESLEALNETLSAWVTSYNTTIHSSIGMTPMDAYQRGIADVRVPEDARWVRECFLNRIWRTVRGDSTVTIDKVSYDVPMQFMSSRIEIRHQPKDMTGAHILSEGLIYPISVTDRVANSKIKRMTDRYRVDYGIRGGSGDGDA